MTTLSCSEIRERIVLGDEDAALRAHVQACPECKPILAAMEDLDADLAALPVIDASDALVERTIERVKSDPPAEAPSLLAAAFAMLTTALGALITAPLVALNWLLGVGTESAKERREVGRPGRGMVLAMGSVLVLVVAFSTWQRFGSTVKTKTRGADMVVNGLPEASADVPAYDRTGEIEGEEATHDWWAANSDQPNLEEGRGPSGAAVAQGWGAIAPTAPSAGEWAGDDLDRQQIVAGDLGVAHGYDPQPVDELSVLSDGRETVNGLVDGIEDIELLPTSDAPAPTHHAAGPMRITGTTVDRSIATLAPEPATRRPVAAPEELEQDQQEITLQTEPTFEANLRGERQRDLGGRFDDDDGDGTYRLATPTLWDQQQSTTGLTFASSQSWWANTYVPGDAALRVLHARLAGASGVLPGTALSALALAEQATPTVPAVAAPTDRALALGVHADRTAIEGPTRVRMEIALRAIDQAAGRRGALRIALVVDARGGLGAEETAHLRSLLAALSHSLSPRDRVILTAAGPAGGTLVPLGVLRHGQVEVALRHLGDTASITGEAIPTSLSDALAAGLEAVSTDDDGAGLTLLVTPNGSHDAAVDQALHLGAVAGVPTTAIGIGSGASTSSLDAIALAGEGRRRLVLGDDDATRAVREELTAASRLVARALRVRIRLADGVQLVDVVGSHALDTEETRRTRESERAIDQSLARRLGIGQDRDDDDSGIRILVPSFYAGDAHTIVLDLLVTRPGPVADVDVRFKDLVRLGNGTASGALALEAGTAPRGPHELRVVASALGHEVAGALDDAAYAMDRGDVATARARLSSVRALIDQARAAVDGLASMSALNADANLLDQFLAATASASDPSLVASSLHYAAARRIVIPQLQAP